MFMGENRVIKKQLPKDIEFLNCFECFRNSLENATSIVLQKITNKQPEQIKWEFHKLQFYERLNPTML